MMKDTIKEKLIVKYLLGQLSDAKMVKIEEKYVTDKNFFEQLLAIEDDLIDDYVRGRLTRRQRRQFETYFLSTPERRDKLEFAFSLLNLIPESRNQMLDRVMARITFLNDQVNQLFKSPIFQTGLATAVVVLIITIAWLLVQFKQKLTEQQSLKPLLVSFNLLPGTYREDKSSVIHSPFIITNNVQLVQLRLEVWSEETYESYRAMLKAPSGEEIWQQNLLKLQTTNRGNFIVLMLPQNLFSDGEYEIELSGKKLQGEFKNIGYYYFKIVKQ